MLPRVALLLALFLIMSRAESPAPTCPEVAQFLSRAWTNELGSTMELKATADGALSGRYNSSVGRAENWYPLTGRMTCGAAGKNPTVAFTVGWKNEKTPDGSSATGWSGQVTGLGTVSPRIQTTWLLTRATSAADSWSSTMVGKDTFAPTPGYRAALRGAARGGT